MGSPATRAPVVGCAAAIGAAALLLGCAQTMEPPSPPAAAPAPPSDPAEALPIVPTSVNALMVYLIDPTAHEIWDYNYADEPLTERDWMLVQQYANNLAAGAVLLSLGGNGPIDQTWVTAPEWRQYAHQLQAGAFEAMGAVDTRNAVKLNVAGNDILATCQGCHDRFKPDVPTEGLTHIPHGSPDFEG